MSPHVNYGAISIILSGIDSYDELGEHEQAIVRQEWADRAATLRATLGYAAQFDAAGDSYSEVNDDGTLAVYPSHD